MRKVYFLLLTVFFAAISNAQVNVTTTSGLTSEPEKAGNFNICDEVVTGTFAPPVVSDLAIPANDVPSSIITNPSDAAACPGSNIVFSIGVTGVPTGYQWQLSTNAGVTFSNINGATAINLTVNSITTVMNNNRYRCIVSGTDTSTAAILTVYNPVAFTTQPVNASVCAGANATFSVVATGSPSPLAYQWQLSIDGGVTFNNIAGANFASLTLGGVSLAQNNYRYLCTVTGYCGALNSSAVTLTVNSSTPVSITALPARICVNDTLINLSATPIGGVWSGIGIIGNTFLPYRTAAGIYSLKYTYTNATSCVSSASVVASVINCPERIATLENNGVLLYPNPNNGRFNLRINSNLYNYLLIRIFDATGHLVNGSVVGRSVTPPTYTGLMYGRVIPIDISYMPSGVYKVNVYYDDGVGTGQTTINVVVAHN